ncbi:Ff.00g113450.m01.CDS01 [Fusarium sp. VM40]|nr:Ff.00g113450.m01.CDS01 [Fusarium sp. VM40]
MKKARQPNYILLKRYRIVLRLLETTSGFLEPDLQYVALSYCWGPEGGTLTTTLNNIEAHKKRIPFDHLPSTIKDDVFVCRNLSINYLWVDALCIIQDPGNADWVEQSGRMNLIYSNAALTIAADDSPTCTAGFWLSENTKFQRVSEDYWIRETPPSSRDILSTRGWTLQERILSHRILHFSNARISWECDASCRSEDGITKIDFIGLSYRAFRLLNRCAPHESIGKSLLGDGFEDSREGDYDPVHITDFLTSGSWKSIFFAWACIIENYSTRDLTQLGDKLSAISGLASFVLTQAGLGAESYLAGLWREDLVEGLLWYVSTARPSRSAAPYVAPTWSWASMTGSIHYFRDRYQFPFMPHVSISGANCTISPADPTGRVTGGTIHLAGLMVEVELAVIACSPSLKSSYKDTGDIPIRAQDQQVAFVRPYQKAGDDKTRWYEVMHDEESKINRTGDLFYGREAEISVNKSLDDRSDRGTYFCLSVGELIDSFTGGQRDWFLILQKAIGNDVYKRVGIGYFQYSTSTEFSLFLNGDVYDIALI